MPSSDQMTAPSASYDLMRYFRTAGLTALAVLIVTVTINYLVDPFLIHQWDTEHIQRLRSAHQKIMPWAKTYAVYKYRPEVVYLGSSRTEIGLPADVPIFAGKRVFNLAIQGSTFGDAVRMLRHTSVFHRPEIVVWGIDYGDQFREENGNTDLIPALTAEDSSYSFRRMLLNLKRSASMDMLFESLKILSGSAEQECPSLLATYGLRSSQCMEHVMREKGGTAAAFAKVMGENKPLADPPDVQATLGLLDQVTDEYCREGTVFRLYLQPVHALAELSYWGGKQDALDDWKRALTAVVDERRKQGCDIRLVDYSGFNRITSEDVPQVSGRENMQYYWEHSHYRSEVGEMILKHLFGTDRAEDANDFGVELTSATIERHLSDFRTRRLEYIRRHPQETANMVR